MPQIKPIPQACYDKIEYKQVLGLLESSVDQLTDEFLGYKFFAVQDRELVREVFARFAKKKLSYLVYPSILVLPNPIKGYQAICRKSTLANRLAKLDAEAKIVPKTYVLRGSSFEEDLKEMLEQKKKYDINFSNPLIIKPGQFSSRGEGISLAFSLE